MEYIQVVQGVQGAQGVQGVSYWILGICPKGSLQSFTGSDWGFQNFGLT